MFDLITGSIERPLLHERAPGSKLVAVAAHVAVLTLVIAIPLMGVTNSLPEAPAIMAFVASPPAPPPPPPPLARTNAPPPAPRPAPLKSISTLTVPVEHQSDLKPEPTLSNAEEVATGASTGTPPSAPAPQPPVRIGGQISAPALLRRVDPIYPQIAAAAHLTGMVILEAVVDTRGCVESVKVLRSRHPFLDKAAIEALKEWRFVWPDALVAVAHA